MKANELMIGDWVKDSTQCYVRFDGIGCSDYNEINRNNGYPIRCADEDDRYAAIINEEQGRSYNEHLADIHPIPLTEEILKANADGGSCSFDEFRSLYHLKSNGYHQDISISFDKTWFVPFVEITGMGHATIKVNMQYVHELQHALRLCGLNDLADNFKTE